MNQKRIEYLKNTINAQIATRQTNNLKTERLREQKQANENTDKLSFKATTNIEIRQQSREPLAASEKNTELMKRMADKRRRSLENT